MSEDSELAQFGAVWIAIERDHENRAAPFITSIGGRWPLGFDIWADLAKDSRFAILFATDREHFSAPQLVLAGDLEEFKRELTRVAESMHPPPGVRIGSLHYVGAEAEAVVLATVLGAAAPEGSA